MQADKVSFRRKGIQLPQLPVEDCFFEHVFLDKLPHAQSTINCRASDCVAQVCDAGKIDPVLFLRPMWPGDTVRPDSGQGDVAAGKARSGEGGRHRFCGKARGGQPGANPCRPARMGPAWPFLSTLHQRKNPAERGGVPKSGAGPDYSDAASASVRALSAAPFAAGSRSTSSMIAIGAISP